jgi:hypothetical protein
MPRILLYIFLVIASGVLFYFSFNTVNTNPSSQIQTTLKNAGIIKYTDEDLIVINNKGVYINFPNKSIFYSLRDLGISFDKDKKMNINERIFDEFSNNLEKELLYLTKQPAVSLDNLEFYVLGEGANIKLDREKFLSQITFEKITDSRELRIPPHFFEEFQPLENQKENEKFLNKIVGTPLTIKAGRKVFNVSAQDIKSFTTKKTDREKEIVKFDKEKIISYLKNLNEKYQFPTEVDYEEGAEKLATKLLFRLTEENPNKTFILPITGTYSLNPNMHSKFVEVNKSQQRAYLFENGQMIKELIISTGITWETPSGNFRVLNKVPMTISYSYIWYMPWYLPIGTMMGGYYFGFHEIPYQVSYNGMIYSRDPETIGSPATGGCIQVLKGQAEELFNWAEVGMPVYITE